jgi:hypothetical protein
MTAVDTGLFHVAIQNPMRTSSAVKPDSSITADNHFHAARNSLKLRDSIGPPYRESFQVMCQESLHAVLTKNVFGFVAGLSRSPSPSVRRLRERERTIERLRKARALVGSTDALERFDAW